MISKCRMLNEKARPRERTLADFRYFCDILEKATTIGQRRNYQLPRAGVKEGLITKRKNEENFFFFLVTKLLHLDCGDGHRILYISKTYSTIQRKQGRKEGGGKEERKFVVNLINLKIKKNFKK